MHGMFRANGGCGYVKKPEFLLKVGSNGEVFNPKAELPIKTTLRVSEVYIVTIKGCIAANSNRSL